MKKKYIFLLVLLAVLCIGGMELLFCRYADPELYDKITAPALQLADNVYDYANELLDKAEEVRGDAVAALEHLPPDAPQVADGPTILSQAITTDPLITSLIFEDGNQILTGGNVSMIYYNQGDDVWADLPYGLDDIGRYGCGPTAMSMIVSSMTSFNVDPEAMAYWASQNGYWASQSGSYQSIVQGTAEAFGLDCVSLTDYDADTLRRELATGGIMVALMGPGHFTNGGHFIVLRGVTLSGDVLVADPNSRENSLTAWNAQVIIDELSFSRNDGAPLWLITER